MTIPGAFCYFCNMFNARTKIVAKAPGNLDILSAWGLPHTLVTNCLQRPLAALITSGSLAELYLKFLQDFHTTGLWPVCTDDPEHPWLQHHPLDFPFAPSQPPFPATLRARPAESPPEILLCPGLAPPEALLLVPVRRPADVPAALNWSGSVRRNFNGNDISGCLRSWEDRYGAVITNIGADKLDVLVTHPPTTSEQSREIAEEIHAICPDIVSQGSTTTELLQALVEDSDTWYFWWD